MGTSRVKSGAFQSSDDTTSAVKDAHDARVLLAR